MTKNNLAVFIPAAPLKRVIALKALFICLVIMAGFLSAADAAKEHDTMAMANQLYAEGSMDSLRRSVELYREVTQMSPDSYQAFWKGARSCRSITRMAVIREIKDLKQICLLYGRQGMDMAQRATELKPEEVEGHYYYAVNVGSYAKGASIWSILSEGLKDKAWKHLEKAYELDKGYDGFVLVMHMGLYHEVLPWFAGRNNAKALEHYLEALRLMPADAAYRPQLHVLAGKLMLDQGVEEDMARQILRETAESGIDYFSRKALQILAEHG